MTCNKPIEGPPGRVCYCCLEANHIGKCSPVPLKIIPILQAQKETEFKDTRTYICNQCVPAVVILEKDRQEHERKCHSRQWMR